MTDEQAIKNYVDAEPAISFAGDTDQVILDYINDETETRWDPVSSSQVFEAMDPVEFTALAAAKKVRADRVLGLGDDIQTVPGSNARAELISIFGGGSVTIANLATLAGQSISRGTAAGLGIVRMGEIERARRL